MSNGTNFQKVVYVWNPTPCTKCDRWGHDEDVCIPNHNLKLRAAFHSKKDQLNKQAKVQIAQKPVQIKQVEQIKPTVKDKNKGKEVEVQASTSQVTTKKHVSPTFSNIEILKGPDKRKEVDFNIIPY